MRPGTFSRPRAASVIGLGRQKLFLYGGHSVLGDFFERRLHLRSLCLQLLNGVALRPGSLRSGAPRTRPTAGLHCRRPTSGTTGAAHVPVRRDGDSAIDDGERQCSLAGNGFMACHGPARLVSWAASVHAAVTELPLPPFAPNSVPFGQVDAAGVGLRRLERGPVAIGRRAGVEL